MTDGLISSAHAARILRAVIGPPVKLILRIFLCRTIASPHSALPGRIDSTPSGTEMLYALGLGKKNVATSVWFNPVLPQFKELNDSIERLADNFPSSESVVTKRAEERR